MRIALSSRSSSGGCGRVRSIGFARYWANRPLPTPTVGSASGALLHRPGVDGESLSGRAPFLEPPAHDPLGSDPQELWSEVEEPGIDLVSPGLVHLGLASDLERTGPARVRQDVVDQQRDLRALSCIAPLLGAAEEDAADVDGVLFFVVVERDRRDVRLAVPAHRGQSPEGLLAEILDLFLCEHAHRSGLPSRMSLSRRRYRPRAAGDRLAVGWHRSENRGAEWA